MTRIWFLLALGIYSCKRAAPLSSPRSDAMAISGATDSGLAAPLPSAATTTSAAIVADRSWVAGLKGVKAFDEKHPQGVFAVAFLPDGLHAISSGADRVARIWDLRTGLVVTRLMGQRFTFNHVAFTHDGKRALGAAGAASFWDVSTGDVVRELQAARN